MNRIHKQNKLGNEEKVVDDIKFASKKEARRYEELKLLARQRRISNLELQPKFVLQEGFRHDGKKYRPITYTADFRYYDYDSDELVVEDVKGHKTEVFKLKMKLFLYWYGSQYKFILT